MLPAGPCCLTNSATAVAATRRRVQHEKKISVDARHELVRAIAARYRAGTESAKLHILNEFVAVTGYHRKHAIRVLNTEGSAPTVRQPRLAIYDGAVREALIVLWEASDRVCGKRLKPLLPTLVAALERHGHLRLDGAVRTKVLGASAATIDRMLRTTRASVREGVRPPKRAIPAVRAGVPVRTFGDWAQPVPGYMEGDLVAHCGGTAAGSFVHTLTLTDIASGWTECAALVVREGTLIVEALTRLSSMMPFPLRGFDTDNGGEFLNETW
jgi:hypothetical protein